MAERMGNWQVEAMGRSDVLTIHADRITADKDDRPRQIGRPDRNGAEKLVFVLTSSGLKDMTADEIDIEDCQEKTWDQKGLAHGFWSVSFVHGKNCQLTVTVTNRDGVPMSWDAYAGQINVYPDYD